MVFGIHEKRRVFLHPKHLFCVDLSRNSLDIVAQKNHRCCSSYSFRELPSPSNSWTIVCSRWLVSNQPHLSADGSPRLHTFSDPISGRYIYVQTTTGLHLMFSEFQVWSSECVLCPSNSMSAIGSMFYIDCQCNAGYSGPSGGPCNACPAGSFKAVTGSASCVVCPVNSNALAGSTVMTDCQWYVYEYAHIYIYIYV